MQFIPLHYKFVEKCEICNEIRKSLKSDFDCSVKAFPENIELILESCHLKLNSMALKIFSEICASSNALKLLIDIPNVSSNQASLITTSLFSVAQIKSIFQMACGYKRANGIHDQLKNDDDKKYLFLWSANNPLVMSPFHIPKLLSPAELVNNQWQMALKGDGCDVTLIALDGKQKAHRFILCTHSEHFKHVLSSGCKEAVTSEIIMQCSVKVLKAYLEFIYTRSITALEKCEEFNIQDLFDLLNLSLMHQMNDLEKLCLYSIDKHAKAPEKDALISTIEKIPHEATLYLVLSWCESNPELLQSLKNLLRTLNPQSIDLIYKVANDTTHRPLIKIGACIEGFKSYFSQ